MIDNKSWRLHVLVFLTVFVHKNCLGSKGLAYGGARDGTRKPLSRVLQPRASTAGVTLTLNTSKGGSQPFSIVIDHLSEHDGHADGGPTDRMHAAGRSLQRRRRQKQGRGQDEAWVKHHLELVTCPLNLPTSGSGPFSSPHPVTCCILHIRAISACRLQRWRLRIRGTAGMCSSWETASWSLPGMQAALPHGSKLFVCVIPRRAALGLVCQQEFW